MENLKSKLIPYLRVGAREVSADGITAKLNIYFDSEAHSAKTGFRSTPIIIYVTGAQIPRVGTLSDSHIISSMLSRGYIVALLDFSECDTAVSPALDFALQKIRAEIAEGKFFDGQPHLPMGTYYNSFVVPAGCDVALDRIYFSLDKHGADGTLEKITETWNNDFRGTKGEKLVKWTASGGERKPTQRGFDGSEPIWLDADGTPDTDGEYLRVKHTLARTVLDCVQPNGSPIDLSLYMHIIYPTAPARPVPVMCLASSSEHLAKGTTTADRPHLIGASLRGYAVAMYDYGYVPMARNDHYGYFDGYPMRGAVTGDNWTYSLHFYNDKRIDSAAMRYLRYLALTDDTFALDTEHIGVFGNSKGGCMAYLGEGAPEALPQRRMFEGHGGESRYETENTQGYGFVCAAEPQPWLTYNGEPISSSAQFIYPSCGGGFDFITAGHAPTFISCNRSDNSYFGASNSFVNVCRNADVPTLWFEINKGHTLATGEDMNYGRDTYTAFFAFAGYYLMSNAPEVLYASAAEDGFILKFSGTVLPSEKKHVILTDSKGKAIPFVLSTFYGNTEWSLTPEEPWTKGVYTVTVSGALRADNGKAIVNDGGYRIELPYDIAPKSAVCRPYEKTRSIPLTSFKNGQCAHLTLTNAPDGTLSLAVDEVYLANQYRIEKLYTSPCTFATCNTIIKEGRLTDEDIGRTFRITMRVYDTVSRYLLISLSGCTSASHGVADYKRTVFNAVTKADEWVEISFEHTVYEPAFGDACPEHSVLKIDGTTYGAHHTPIYFSDITVTEFCEKQ